MLWWKCLFFSFDIQMCFWFFFHIIFCIICSIQFFALGNEIVCVCVSFQKNAARCIAQQRQTKINIKSKRFFFSQIIISSFVRCGWRRRSWFIFSLNLVRVMQARESFVKFWMIWNKCALHLWTRARTKRKNISHIIQRRGVEK